MYVLSTGMVNNTFTTDLYKFTDGEWIKAANTLSGVNDACIQIFNNELYIIYLNSSWYPVIAKLENGAWKTIVTDKSAQYPNSPSLFISEKALFPLPLLPMTATIDELSGISKSNQFSLAILSIISCSPTKSAPASLASVAFAPLAITKTFLVFPVPQLTEQPLCGMYL